MIEIRIIDPHLETQEALDKIAHFLKTCKQSSIETVSVPYQEKHVMNTSELPAQSHPAASSIFKNAENAVKRGRRKIKSVTFPPINEETSQFPDTKFLPTESLEKDFKLPTPTPSFEDFSAFISEKISKGTLKANQMRAILNSHGFTSILDLQLKPESILTIMAEIRAVAPDEFANDLLEDIN